MLYIVRTIRNKLLQVEAVSHKHACEIAQHFNYLPQSAWLKDQTQHAAVSQLKRVEAGDYTVLS